LVISILEDGWTQPIVTLPADENGRFQIVDGYHRWKCSTDPRIAKMSEGKVPTVQTRLDPVHRQMSTIRHNRARGTHAVVKMAEIVRSIADDGIPNKEIQTRLGMEGEEVARLTNRAGVPVTQRSEGFGKAWVPAGQ
jgi:ParB-like chromosome segregation protein Spo0J